ncbi:MAG: NAD(P)H-hydrate dehydratase [Clostridia bacterium]|nr:NAD(P)H-hydrate dehydratase [Clostridia bacterium]
MTVLNKASVREAEKKAVESGIFSFTELMGIAGEAAAEKIRAAYDVKNKKIAVVCGKGNNGGDGFVCANILRKEAAVDVIIPFGKPETDDARHYFTALSGVDVLSTLEGDYDIVIDALFGIGLNRTLSCEAVELIEKINSIGGIKIAIDIPSGVEADSGAVMGAAVRADMTVTFIALKPCFLLPESSDYCGKVEVADIGVKPHKADYYTIEKPNFTDRRHNSHKGDFGTAIMICGSYGMCGAAILAARGALRSGVGILRAVICDSIYSPFTAAVPEAVCIPVKTGKNGTADSDDNRIYEHISSGNALLIGCGMGNNEDTLKILEKIIKKADCPIVIDADGINALCRRINIIREAKKEIILTPHPGEMARLCGVTTAEIEQNRIYYASKTAKELNVILVLKGANTIVALPNGKIFFNTTGNPGMATGGSGDVLAGITVSLLAQGVACEEAVKSAVYIHGAAGDLAAKQFGEMGMLPSDIINNL